MTKEQAAVIVQAHGIDAWFDDDEDREMLLENNQELYHAYCAILQLAGMMAS